MRSSLLVRLVTAIALAVIVGVPGLQDLNPLPAEAQTSVYGVPLGGDVWTGALAAPGDAPLAQAPAPEATEPLIVRFRPRAPRILSAQCDERWTTWWW